MVSPKPTSVLGRAKKRHGMGKARAQPVRTRVKRRRDPFADGKRHKLKSHKGAKKRFMLLGDGTWLHKQAGKNHLNAGSSRSRQTQRKLKLKAVTTRGYINKLNRLLPYGGTIRKIQKYVQPMLWVRPEGYTEAILASKKAPHALPKKTWPPPGGVPLSATTPEWKPNHFRPWMGGLTT